MRHVEPQGVQALRRLLFVVPDFYPNVTGYGNACTEFLRALIECSDLAVDVVTFAELGCHTELELDRVTVTRLRHPKLFGKPAIFRAEYMLWRRINRLVRARGHDFVIFETAEFPMAGLLTLASLGHERVVVRIHAAAETEWILYRNHPVYMAKRYPTRWFFRRVRNVFSTTQFYIDFVKRHFLDDNVLLTASKYYQVIPNVTRPAAFRYPQDVPEALLEELAAENHLFLTLGRMDYHGELQKNFRRLLVAFQLMHMQFGCGRARLAIVGSGSRRQELIDIADRLGLTGAVYFYPSLPNSVIRYLQSHCHGVFLASTFEGLSMFALESLASGAPLLVARGGGLGELVEHGENGVLFDPFDPYDIAEKAAYFVREMLPRLDRVRDAARAKFEGSFRRDRVVQRFIENLGILWAMRKPASD